MCPSSKYIPCFVPKYLGLTVLTKYVILKSLFHALCSVTELALNAQVCLNNRTFRTGEQEKLTRKFYYHNSSGLFEVGKHI